MIGFFLGVIIGFLIAAYMFNLKFKEWVNKKMKKDKDGTKK